MVGTCIKKTINISWIKNLKCYYFKELGEDGSSENCNEAGQSDVFVKRQIMILTGGMVRHGASMTHSSVVIVIVVNDRYYFMILGSFHKLSPLFASTKVIYKSMS